MERLLTNVSFIAYLLLAIGYILLFIVYKIAIDKRSKLLKETLKLTKEAIETLESMSKINKELLFQLEGDYDLIEMLLKVIDENKSKKETKKCKKKK